MIDSNTLKGPMCWSLTAIAVIIIFCIFAIATIGKPLLDSGEELTPNSRSNTLIEKHDEYALVDIARFNGRSAFFRPILIPKPRPVYEPPPRKDPEPEEQEPEEKKPDPPPATYLGPPLIAIIGDEAWFRGSGSGFDALIRLQSGQEINGLTLVGTEEPTTAKVQYRGGEYTLPLFTVEERFFSDNPPAASTDDFFEEVQRNLHF